MSSSKLKILEDHFNEWFFINILEKSVNYSLGIK